MWGKKEILLQYFYILCKILQNNHSSHPLLRNSKLFELEISKCTCILSVLPYIENIVVMLIQ